MIALLRSVVAPLFSIILLSMGSGFFITFISVRLKLDGFSDQDVSFVQSAFYAGLLLGAARVEPVIRRVGYIRAFAAFASIHTASMMTQGMWLTPMVWVVMRFISGIAVAGLYVVVEGWLLAKSSLKTRGSVLAIYMTGLYLSQAFAQFFIDLLDALSFDPFFLSGLLCSLSVVPLALSHRESPDLHEPSTQGFWVLARLAPFGVFGCVMSGVVLSSIYSFSPIYAQSTSVPVSQVMFLTISGGFALQWPIGRLSDVWDRHLVLLMVAVGTIIPSVGLVWLAPSAWTILGLSFFVGGLCFALYPLGISQVCDRLDAADFTSACALLLLAYGVGSVIGPLPVPYFIDWMDARGLYLYVALCTGLLALVGLWALAYRPRVPMDEQMDFVALPHVTPVALELDPRNPTES